jgi:hypothetical protein
MKLFEKLGLKDQAQLDKIQAALAEGADDATIDAAASTFIDGVAPLVTGNPKFTQAMTDGAFNKGRTQAFDNMKLTLSSTLGVDLKAAKDITEVVGVIAKSGSKEDTEVLKKSLRQELENEFNAEKIKIKESHKNELRAVKSSVSLDQTVISAFGGKKTVLPLEKVAILAKTDLQDKYKVEFDDDGRIAKILNKDGTEPRNASQTANLTTSEILEGITAGYIEKEKEVTPKQQERTGVILGGEKTDKVYEIGVY